MTAQQVAINHRALVAAAAKVERLGYDGDAFAFVENLIVSVLADGYRNLEPVPPPSDGGSQAARDAARAATAAAIRAAKDRRKKPAEETA